MHALFKILNIDKFIEYFTGWWHSNGGQYKTKITKFIQTPINFNIVMVQIFEILMKDIKNNAWVIVNNDVWSRVRWFANDFHEWRIHGNECIILFPARYVMSWTHNSAKKLSIAHFAITVKEGLFWLSIVTSPQLICDVKRTRVTSTMTSYSSIVLAHANLRKGDLH